jgi:hypothetical protein
MIRRLFSIASSLSLLLALAVVALWARSHFRKDRLAFLTARHETRIVSNRGCLMFRRMVEFHSPPLAIVWDVDDPVRYFDDSDPWWNRLGFYATGLHHLITDRPNSTVIEMTIVLPDWFLVLLLGVPPLLWTRRRFVARRPKMGVCRTCGYDLRASVGRCPECGSPIPAADGNGVENVEDSPT